MNVQNIKGIIFDLGSTLLEYENIPWDELNMRCLQSGYSFLREEGFSLPDFEIVTREYIRIRQKYRDFAYNTLEEWIITDAIADLLSAIGLNSDKSLSRKFFEAYYGPVSRQLTLFADTATVLEKLGLAGFEIGLVSNTIFPEEYHIRELERYRLLEYFDFKIFSSSFGYRKPHRAIYNRAIELSGNISSELIFVGDRYIEDYIGPRENGIASILKFREGREYPEPYPHDMIMIKSLSELLPIVMNRIDDFA